MRITAAFMAIFVTLFAGCGDTATQPGTADVARAETLRPQDPQLAERYERSCMTCHAARGSGAPLAGFAPQWAPRLDKGMDELVRNTYDGFNAMPARGLCNDCTPDDLRALIRFMSSGAPS